MTYKPSKLGQSGLGPELISRQSKVFMSTKHIIGHIGDGFLRVK